MLFLTRTNTALIVFGPLCLHRSYRYVVYLRPLGLHPRSNQLTTLQTTLRCFYCIQYCVIWRTKSGGIHLAAWGERWVKWVAAKKREPLERKRKDATVFRKHTGIFSGWMAGKCWSPARPEPMRALPYAYVRERYPTARVCQSFSKNFSSFGKDRWQPVKVLDMSISCNRTWWRIIFFSRGHMTNLNCVGGPRKFCRQGAGTSDG